MTLTYYERGLIEGRNKERLELTILQLETRFGPRAAAVRKRVEGMSPEQLRELLLAIVHAQSLNELGFEG